MAPKWSTRATISRQDPRQSWINKLILYNLQWKLIWTHCNFNLIPTIIRVILSKHKLLYRSQILWPQRLVIVTSDCRLYVWGLRVKLACQPARRVPGVTNWPHPAASWFVGTFRITLIFSRDRSYVTFLSSILQVTLIVIMAWKFAERCSIIIVIQNRVIIVITEKITMVK